MDFMCLGRHDSLRVMTAKQESKASSRAEAFGDAGRRRPTELSLAERGRYRNTRASCGCLESQAVRVKKDRRE